MKAKRKTFCHLLETLHTVTVRSSAGSFAQNQISDEKNCMVAAFVSAHPRGFTDLAMLASITGFVLSYCIFFSVGSATEQQLVAFEIDTKTTPPRYHVTLSTIVPLLLETGGVYTFCTIKVVCAVSTHNASNFGLAMLSDHLTSQLFVILNCQPSSSLFDLHVVV